MMCLKYGCAAFSLRVVYVCRLLIYRTVLFPPLSAAAVMLEQNAPILGQVSVVVGQKLHIQPIIDRNLTTGT
jgi:hypothetical protein